eukprot:gene12995-13124_t
MGTTVSNTAVTESLKALADNPDSEGEGQGLLHAELEGMLLEGQLSPDAVEMLASAAGLRLVLGMKQVPILMVRSCAKKIGLVIIDPPAGLRKHSWDAAAWGKNEVAHTINRLKMSVGVADTFRLAVYCSSMSAVSGVCEAFQDSGLCSKTMTITFVDDAAFVGGSQRTDVVVGSFQKVKGGPSSSTAPADFLAAMEEDRDLGAFPVRFESALRDEGPFTSVYGRWKALGSTIAANKQQRSVP